MHALLRSFCRVERNLGLVLVDAEGSPDVTLGREPPCYSILLNLNLIQYYLMTWRVKRKCIKSIKV